MSFRGRGGGRGGGGRGGRGGFRGGGRGGGRGGFQQRDFGPPDYVTGNGRPYSLVRKLFSERLLHLVSCIAGSYTSFK